MDKDDFKNLGSVVYWNSLFEEAPGKPAAQILHGNGIYVS
jgi:hypothetical protein